MGKTQFCRICRTENNLKYTTKELKQLNKKQLLLAQATQQGRNRASKKLLLTTPTLGNICQLCDERIQIFHRLDDHDHETNSDVEIEIVNSTNASLPPIKFSDAQPDRDFLQSNRRPETPVIVDDDEMLFDIFMQKFDQKTQLQRHQTNTSLCQHQLEKQFANQFHTTYTPPQSTGGGSEGDESKVIDVLTSRESTPAPIQPVASLTSNSNLIDTQGHRIVAIIELDDDESEQTIYNEGQNSLCNVVTRSLNDTGISEHRSVLLSPKEHSEKSQNIQEVCTKSIVEDDEEIVFRKVDKEHEKISTIKKRNRKCYDDKELRLVASLSLLSSDSETEESPAKVQPKMPTTFVAETQVIKKSLKCSVCELTYPDNESLSVHELIHQGVKCTLCQIGFQQIKRLIHHMRRKHREYNGDVLSENPRSGQDSCMTIRLRYMQRTTFYECQLCGRIDDVFREHKEHIIEKHPNESKSLKDPIMKQLKCPICKAKCGVQYLSLCRHIINSHEYQEYKNHLRELIHVSSFGWNAARQQEVAKTANIFQFVKRKTFFFECKICNKVVAGYLNHLRHVREHQMCLNNSTKVEINTFKKSPPTEACSKEASLNTPKLDKICKRLKQNRVHIQMKLRKKDNTSQQLNHNDLHNKTKRIEAVNISKNMQKPTKNDLQSKFKINNEGKAKKLIETVKLKKSIKVEEKSESRKKIKLTSKQIPKDTEKMANCEKLAKGKSKKVTSKKVIKKLKEKSTKVKNLELKPQVIKVKVKAFIRQIDLQKYKCKYCLKKFKGFRLYNLHLLRKHKENEYTKCNKCKKTYTFSNFEKHREQCAKIHYTFKQKRKFSKHVSLSENLIESSQACVKTVLNISDVNSTKLEDNQLWLKDLLKLKAPLKISDISNFPESPKTALAPQKPIISQCCYCLHLFANDRVLKEHIKHHNLQNHDILIKYKPFKIP